ncbi:MAG: hypothetical protein IJV26_11870, partial [Lachnospiraceae bacterium]|nr:hypothetical protein [Lachnospiraceae bacterium]
DMAEYAGWFPYFGYWKEENKPLTSDFRPVASGKGEALQDGEVFQAGEALQNRENEYVLKTRSGEKVTVRVNWAGEKAQGASCETETGEQLRIRTIWYDDGRGGQSVTDLQEEDGAAGTCDLVMLGSDHGSEINEAETDKTETDKAEIDGAQILTIWLLPTRLSDSMFGELYYKQGKWQDHFELVREPREGIGEGLRGGIDEGLGEDLGEGGREAGITVSLWKVR